MVGMNTGSQKIECRPYDERSGVCAYPLTGDHWTTWRECMPVFGCPPGMYCRQAVCETFCDEEHPTCGEDAGCTYPDPGTVGICR